MFKLINNMLKSELDYLALKIKNLEDTNSEREWNMKTGAKFNNVLSKYPISDDDAIVLLENSLKNKFNYKMMIKTNDAIKAAIEIIKESKKGCEYCNSIDFENSKGRIFYKEFSHDTRFLTTLDDAHLQNAFDNMSGWVLHFEDDNGDRMFDIKITHCPHCGRKLGENNG